MKIAVLIFCTFLLSACSFGDKTGYIDINKVYSEINVTKKYQTYLSKVEEQFAQKIKAQRSENQQEKDLVLAKKNPTQKELAVVFKLQEKLDSVEEYYSKAFTDSSSKYNLKIEKLVNNLVYEFGQENNYDYLFSPASSNSFMYADSTLDLSQKVIEYINLKTK